MTECASESCAPGDIPQDITAMQSIYASYCMGAGFTQPGATAWFNPAIATASTTTGGSVPATTTVVDVVTFSPTRNSGSGSGVAAGTQSQQGKMWCLLRLGITAAVVLLQVGSFFFHSAKEREFGEKCD